MAGGEPLRWRCWAGDYVVFSPLSGHTHLLDILTGQVLTVIMAESPSVAELRSQTSTFLEVENDERLAKTIDGILSRLEEAGLVESAG